MFRHIIVLTFLSLFCAGCHSVSVEINAADQKEAESSLTSVAGALAGKKLSPEDIKKLEKQIATDKDAQSAVKSIGNSMQGQAMVKYCPVDGQRYSAHLTICPDHGVELKSLDE